MVSQEELLASSEPWVVYRTWLDLAGLPDSDPRVSSARQAMLEHPLVRGLIKEIDQWPGIVLNSHKSAGQLYHKLAFLADLGLTRNDLGQSDWANKLVQSRSSEGLFQLPMQIPASFGGSNQPTLAWALCDAPLLLYSTVKMNLDDDPKQTQQGLAYLISLSRENGWPCVVSSQLGSFRGPGKKADPCPYATLLMLKLLPLFAGQTESLSAATGVDCLLSLWQDSLSQHPYQFYMGTDFRKLKAPMIWYDILHVADVLSQYAQARQDPRYIDLLTAITDKADSAGRYTPESVWQAWLGWDFGQKKQPSAWLDLVIARLLHRQAN